jgi:hypothetical protein
MIVPQINFGGHIIMDKRLMGKIVGLVASGAEVKEVRSLGLILIKTGTGKRTRRTKEEMTRDKKKAQP